MGDADYVEVDLFDPAWEAALLPVIESAARNSARLVQLPVMVLTPSGHQVARTRKKAVNRRDAEYTWGDLSKIAMTIEHDCIATGAPRGAYGVFVILNNLVFTVHQLQESSRLGDIARREVSLVVQATIAHGA